MVTHLKLLACLRCGAECEVVVSVPKVYCDECRVLTRNERQLARYHRKVNGHKKRDMSANTSLYELVYTPESFEDGAYNPGASFTRTELAFGLSYGSFVAGTIFYDPIRDKEWTVRHRQVKHYGQAYILEDEHGVEFKPRYYG